MTGRALPSAFVFVALGWACESEYDPNADVSDRPRECGADLEYRSCARLGSCVEWGYPPERISEIDEPGRKDCVSSGGTWQFVPCRSESYAAGCRSVWSETCATVWVAAAAGELEERKQVCESFLGGVWLVPASR